LTARRSAPALEDYDRLEDTQLRFFSVVLVLLGASLLAACGGDDDKTVNVPGGGEISTSDDLPDDWPDDFPIYDGADYKGGFQSSSQGVSGFAATWETGDDIDDVQAFYAEAFADGPWKQQSTTSAGGSTLFFVTRGDDDTQGGVVTISEQDGKVQILAIVGDQGESSDSDSSDEDEATAEPDGDGASASLPDEVDLPADFPDDRFPIKDGARVTAVSTISSGGQRVITVELYAQGSVSDLADYYKGAMPDNGWTESFVSSAGGATLLTYSSANQTEVATLTIDDSATEGYAVLAGSIALAE